MAIVLIVHKQIAYHQKHCKTWQHKVACGIIRSGKEIYVAEKTTHFSLTSRKVSENCLKNNLRSASNIFKKGFSLPTQLP